MATGNGEGYDAARFESDLTILHADDNPDPTALQYLAAASRQSESARLALARPENLEALVRRLVLAKDTKVSPQLLDAPLRCIGNACADNNAARDTVTALGFGWVRDCMSKGNNQLGLLATQVLFNICSDHDASQQQCYKDGLHYEVIGFLHHESAVSSAENSSCAIDLLFWISAQKAPVEPTRTESMPPGTLSNLLDLPELYKTADVESFSCIIESIFCFIRDPTVQKQIITDDLFPALATKSFGSIVDRPRNLDPTNEEDAEDLKLLLPLATSYVWCLSDIAAQPGFAKAYSLEHPAIRHLIDYIQVRNTDQWAIGKSDHWKRTCGVLLTACCEVVGNLLWALPSESYASLVEVEHLERPLFAEIVRAEDASENAAIMHSVVGLLIHLSRPSPKVRTTMGGDESTLPALQRLCRHDMQQIKQGGAKLLRSLGKDCPSNQERFAELGTEVMVSLMEEQKKSADADPS